MPNFWTFWEFNGFISPSEVKSSDLKWPRWIKSQPFRVFSAWLFWFQFSLLLSYFLIRIIWIIYFHKVNFKIMIDKIKQLRYYLKAIMSNGQADQFYAFFESSLKTVGNRLSSPFTFWSHFFRMKPAEKIWPGIAFKILELMIKGLDSYMARFLKLPHNERRLTTNYFKR